MKQTIALIDDDRNILTSLSIALEKEGYKVQTYLDGESALIGLTRTPPDLAVVDIKMPKMDGEELLKKLRKKTSLPVIFLTSKDDEVDELLGLKLGADDFVKKSGGFSIKVLIERIRVQLRKKDNKSIEDTNSSIFSQIKGAIETPWNNLKEEKKKVKNISQEVNILVNKNKDEKINNKSVNTKYLITSLFVIIIIFLTIRAFIYLETNNIDIIILVSIIFLIAYQFI